MIAPIQFRLRLELKYISVGLKESNILVFKNEDLVGYHTSYTFGDRVCDTHYQNY